MSCFYLYILPAPYHTMFPTPSTQHTGLLPYSYHLPPVHTQTLPPPPPQPSRTSYHLPPVHTQTLPAFCPPPQPYSLGSRDPRRGQQYHHYYGPWPWHARAAHPWNYPSLHAHPPAAAPSPPRAPPRLQTRGGPWPEGFTLRGELRWGRLERVFGPRRELPEFVREDLRRVYGTYPRTDLSISYQGGEYVVRGDPRAAQQEYRLERRVVRQADSEEGDGVSQAPEKRKRRGRKGR